MEHGGDFQDLLEAYTEEMEQSLGAPPMNDSSSNSSKERSGGSVTSGNAELSWEVMDLDDHPSNNATNITDTSSKNKSDPDEWVLQPDIEKSTKDDTFPVIQNVVSLSSLPDDPQFIPESNKSEQGQTPVDSSSSSSEDEDSEALVIDTSANIADGEHNFEASAGKSKERANNSHVTVKDKTQGSSLPSKKQEDDRASSTESFGDDDSGRSLESRSQSPTRSKETSSKSSNQSETSERDRYNKSGDTSSEEENEEENKDNVESPPSPEQIEVYSINPDIPLSETKQPPTNQDKKLPSKTSELRKSLEKPVHVQAQNSKKTGSLLKEQSYTIERGNQNETVIVIEPTPPNYEPVTLEPISFTPGKIKQENIQNGEKNVPHQITSQPRSVTVSTRASLSTNTLVSSSTRVQPSLLTRPTILYQVPQPPAPRASIIRSPQAKAIPQVVFRNLTPGPRHSIVRLGSQALHQIARLTSPPGSTTSAGAPRMISVLMDRMPSSVAGQTTPMGQSSLVNSKTPQGTNSSSSNQPVKFLIIPSQGGSVVPLSAVKPTSVTSGTSNTAKKVVQSGLMNTQPTLKNKPDSLSSAASKLSEITETAKLKKTPSGAKIAKIPTADIGDNLVTMEERFKRRFLSKNNVLTKPYHPLLSGKMSSIGFRFFSCYGCRDVFVNERSLNLHKTRQSVNIFFRCKTCKLKILFNNKCQFRYHLLKHQAEIKNFSKHLLDSIDIQSIQNNMPTDFVQDSVVNYSFEKGKFIVEGENDITQKVGTEQEVKKVIQSTENTESGLGLTISSVSSISPDENIPVGDIPQVPEPTSKQVQRVPFTASITQPSFPSENLPSVSKIQKTGSTTLAVPVGGSSFAFPVAGLNIKGQFVPIKPITSTHLPQKKQTAEVSSPALKLNKSLLSIKPKPKMTPLPQEIIQDPFVEKPTNTDNGHVFCPECKETFPSYMQLQKHFNDADKHHILKPPCCTTKLYSECCVRAHMRAHKLQKPYVCQDCGEYFRSHANIFTKHTSNCAKVIKSAVIVYPCPRCPDWYPNIDELRNHIRSKHSESYLKCNQCPMAFKSMPSFLEHSSSKHDSSEHPDYSSIYKCPLCDSVFHDQKMKLEHMEHHINSIYALQKVSFLCYICNKLMRNYVSMRNHLRDKHGVSALGKVCDYCGVDCGTMESLISHLQENHDTIPANMVKIPDDMEEVGVIAGEKEPESETVNGKLNDENLNHEKESHEDNTIDHESGDPSTPDVKGGDDHSPGNLSRNSSLYSEAQSDDNDRRELKCHICLAPFTSRRSLVRHKKLDHGLMKRKNRPRNDTVTKKIKIDPEKDSATPELQVKSDFMLRFICDSCSYRTSTFADLQEHRHLSHGLQARFPCHLCGKTYDSQSKVDDHIKDSHEGQARQYIFVCWLCEAKSIRKGYNKRMLLIKHLYNAHRLSARLVDTARIDEMEAKYNTAMELKKGTKQEADEKREEGSMSGVFTCVKCDYQCVSREEFTGHIHKHKVTTDSYLCHECGMCFTVMTALKNHLRLVHKIKKFDEYVEKYNIHVVAATSPVEEPFKSTTPKKGNVDFQSTRNPLECNVCYKVLGHSGALKNHMRTHGMAFIRSKRMGPCIN